MDGGRGRGGTPAGVTEEGAGDGGHRTPQDRRCVLPAGRCRSRRALLLLWVLQSSPLRSLREATESPDHRLQGLQGGLPDSDVLVHEQRPQTRQDTPREDRRSEVLRRDSETARGSHSRGAEFVLRSEGKGREEDSLTGLLAEVGSDLRETVGRVGPDAGLGIHAHPGEVLQEKIVLRGRTEEGREMDHGLDCEFPESRSAVAEPREDLREDLPIHDRLREMLGILRELLEQIHPHDPLLAPEQTHDHRQDLLREFLLREEALCGPQHRAQDRIQTLRSASGTAESTVGESVQEEGQELPLHDGIRELLQMDCELLEEDLLVTGGREREVLQKPNTPNERIGEELPTLPQEVFRISPRLQVRSDQFMEGLLQRFRDFPRGTEGV